MCSNYVSLSFAVPKVNETRTGFLDIQKFASKESLFSITTCMEQDWRILILLFSRNMVVALKEVSIRGDFRTTVEYLIKLLEHESFMKNQIDTGWLDVLISERVQVRLIFS